MIKITGELFPSTCKKKKKKKFVVKFTNFVFMYSSQHLLMVLSHGVKATMLDYVLAVREFEYH